MAVGVESSHWQFVPAFLQGSLKRHENCTILLLKIRVLWYTLSMLRTRQLLGAAGFSFFMEYHFL
ncbi:hypothetical protein ACTM9N_00750 [Lachnospiraceae bacterium HCP1S3_A8]|nr:hypothetical protein [Lachnospiraceae bacterium]